MKQNLKQFCKKTDRSVANQSSGALVHNILPSGLLPKKLYIKIYPVNYNFTYSFVCMKPGLSH